MEVDHVTYIFGSFSRRRYSRETSSNKIKTVSPSSVEPTHKETRASIDANSDNNVEQFLCPLCRKKFSEPRVLECLHTFCTPCLKQLESTYNGRVPDDDCSEISSTEYLVQSSGSSPSKRNVKGFGSYDGITLGCNGFQNLCSKRHSFSIMCPICDTACALPPGGAVALPPNYVIQHRMVLASLNNKSTNLLCDLCSTDCSAKFRCMECLLNLCQLCQDIHRSQKDSSLHEVLPLEEARQRGITRVRSQAMCPLHPDFELEVFCIPCRQVACRQCCRSFHRGHKPRETASNASYAFSCSVHDILEKAKPFLEKINEALKNLDAIDNRIKLQCEQIEADVNRFIDGYIVALEEHRNSLQSQLQQIRRKKLQIIEEQRLEIQKRSRETMVAIDFTDNLLTEGSHLELLSFVSPILHRLQWCSDLKRGTSRFLEPKVSESVQFLPHKKAGVYNCYTLYGTLVTQTVSPQLCILNTDGLHECRQNQKVEAVLHTVDSEGQPLRHGGENVLAELCCRDSMQREVPVQVHDQKDGTYLISFTPVCHGSYTLSISVNSKPVRKSPFHIRVRNVQPHHGKFHCCSFCSSRGSKEAACGCGGTMPGGYKGCGHGHIGHPGHRHWSCCGSTVENSGCTHGNSAVYQYTL